VQVCSRAGSCAVLAALLYDSRASVLLRVAGTAVPLLLPSGKPAGCSPQESLASGWMWVMIRTGVHLPERKRAIYGARKRESICLLDSVQVQDNTALDQVVDST
jgi:hypothetical protein